MLILLGAPALSAFRDDVPPTLEFIVLRCLEKTRERRFASVSELSAALSAFVVTGAVPSALFPASPAAREIRSPVRPRRRWAGALLSIAVVGACVWVLGLGIRGGHIHVPSKADIMRLPASLRLSLEQRIVGQSPAPDPPND